MKKTYTTVQIGWNTRLCFANPEDAIEFYRLTLTAIPVESNYGKLPDGREGVSWIRDDDISISLDRVAESNIEIRYTKKDLEERATAKDDVDGHAKLIESEEVSEPKLLTVEAPDF